jgi:hypothetical protein
MMLHSGLLLPYSANIRLGWKGLPVDKHSQTLGPGVNVINFSRIQITMWHNKLDCLTLNRKLGG